VSAARQEASARVHAALDKGEVPSDEDILVCETDALVRAQYCAMAMEPLACHSGARERVNEEAVERGRVDAARRRARRQP